MCALIALIAGCSAKPLSGVMRANQRPTVTITQAPAPKPAPSSYAYEISWAGFDVDGQVSSFKWVLDPPSAAGVDTPWVSTRENRRMFVFRADSIGTDTRAHGYHTFVVKAVDDRRAESAPAVLSFNSTTIAPIISITQPVPSAIHTERVSTSLHIAWTGDDPDGLGSHRPVKWKYKLFADDPVLPIAVIVANPDTIGSLYAPRFAGWDSLPGPAGGVDLRDLTLGHLYLFVLVAFDTAGAYSPVFSPYDNMLQFFVDPTISLGPTIALYNDSFYFKYPSGGFTTDPANYLHENFAADVPLPLQWLATPASGGFIRGYRWAVDLHSLDDETPRSNEDTDFAHWSRMGSTNSTVLPAFHPGAGSTSETHFFYLEADDNAGLRSLAIMEFNVVLGTFDRPLLIVDDTWFLPDKRLANGCVDKPRQAWPTAAELDTFLYAVGNKPWRCYPAGTLSPPGLFAGYDFDTIGTHNAPVGGVSLEKLAHYRNVLWITDGGSAVSDGSGGRATPLIRELVRPGNSNPLVTWQQLGGRLWLMGGGVAYATMRDFGTLQRPTNVFSFDQGELVPGRFMYSYAHWQHELTVDYANQATRSIRAVGGWPGAPDYSAAPAKLEVKTPDTDPLPPQRTGGDGFWSLSCYGEYITQPTSIVEPVYEGGGRTYRSMLDTIYVTQGGLPGNGRPIMTYYHGTESGPLIFSGFPLWYFRRTNGIALLDFVLQNMMGLSRRPVPR